MAAGLRTREKGGEKKPTRYYSNKQEKSVARAVGGRQTANSGATDFGGKSDILTEDFALECKTKMTASDSISIKKEWITKTEKEAVFMGKKYTALAFNFGPDEPNYYIIDEYLFQDLLEYLRNKDE